MASSWSAILGLAASALVASGAGATEASRGSAAADPAGAAVEQAFEPFSRSVSMKPDPACAGAEGAVRRALYAERTNEFRSTLDALALGCDVVGAGGARFRSEQRRPLFVGDGAGESLGLRRDPDDLPLGSDVLGNIMLVGLSAGERERPPSYTPAKAPAAFSVDAPAREPTETLAAVALASVDGLPAASSEKPLPSVPADVTANADSSPPKRTAEVSAATAPAPLIGLSTVGHPSLPALTPADTQTAVAVDDPALLMAEAPVAGPPIPADGVSAGGREAGSASVVTDARAVVPVDAPSPKAAQSSTVVAAPAPDSVTAEKTRSNKPVGGVALGSSPAKPARASAPPKPAKVVVQAVARRETAVRVGKLKRADIVRTSMAARRGPPLPRDPVRSTTSQDVSHASEVTRTPARSFSPKMSAAGPAQRLIPYAP